MGKIGTNILLQCGSCRFFAMTQNLEDGRALGQCRKSPPIMIYPEEGKPISDWPLTSSVGFCGNHELPCVTEAHALEYHELTQVKTPTWRQGFDLPLFGVEAYRIVREPEDLVEQGTQGWVVLRSYRHTEFGEGAHVEQFLQTPPIGLIARFEH